MNTPSVSEAAADAAQSMSSEVMLRLAAALEDGDLSVWATARMLQAELGVPSSRLDPLRRLLAAGADTEALPTIIRVAVAAADRIRSDAPRVEIAATQPRGGARTRTTGGVAREVVAGATERLLLVGYRVTTDPSLAGLAARTLVAIGEAASRGVVVSAILHRDEANREAFLRAWPPAAVRPSIYTWPDRHDDAMAKMHAKVLIADSRDAFVTSANLTYHGFVGNVEMGVRITGKPAKTVAAVFDQLLTDGEFVDWNPS